MQSDLPRAEAEIAFVLKSDFAGPGVDGADVLAATEPVCACFEIVDSRIANCNVGIVDTIAENALCSIFALGEDRIDPHDVDLPSFRCEVWKDGVSISEGYGSAVHGSPLTAVAWLANTLSSYHVPLKAGEIIMSGFLVPLEPARPGDVFEMAIDGLGRAKIGFC